MSDYGVKRESERARNAEKSASGRDIGTPPDVADPTRRARGLESLEFFLREYFPHTFSLPFSRNHLRAISRAQEVVTKGGLFALAMPRGSGKTSICECAAIYAVSYALRRYVVLVGSSSEHAAELLGSIKTEFETNDFLLADFPEICYPISRLEGINNRCRGQLCNGERTAIEWTAKRIVLPTIAGSAASGAIVQVAGIEGRIRGMKHKDRSGASLRPDLVIPDDPQTDESARSADQVRKRLGLINGAILGLAGPGCKISALVPCTVISQGDVADQILDRDKFPQWQGERTRMVESWPSHPQADYHWRKYAELRDGDFRGGTTLATDYYAAHRREMDEGFVCAWPEAFNPDELSAQQSAMNLRLQNEPAFWAERQNEPQADLISDCDLTAPMIKAKANGLPRGQWPAWTRFRTAFIDVQQRLYYWGLVAWGEDFTGHVVDYGAWPQQNKSVYALSDSDLMSLPKGTTESVLMAEMPKLLELLSPHHLDRIGIDANWGQSTRAVYAFSRGKPACLPMHGRYVGPRAAALGQWKLRPGDIAGDNWILRSLSGADRYLAFDSNFYKSHFCDRLALDHGLAGGISICGGHSEHAGLVDQLLSEYRVRASDGARTVDEWRLKPHRPDNHWLDCLAGCAALGSSCGAKLIPDVAASPRVKRKLSDIQRDKRRS